jgi:hypothetical protein
VLFLFNLCILFSEGKHPRTIQTVKTFMICLHRSFNYLHQNKDGSTDVIVVRAPDFGPRCPRFEIGARQNFHDLGNVSEVLDDRAVRRKGALAVYSPPG